ncbi:polyprenyl synthetase family protein [Aureimonas altamirensis]|nr:polyprenyl synthetase family protein [Aureimonas altamirensis]UHD47086.1 polyprenyl synthetase family protein [Aureimonas altamirensis]
MRKRALADFAEHLGHAFQLYDDLLDTSGDPLVIGKDIGKDGAKATLLRQEGAAGAQVRLNQHLDAAHATLESVFGRDCRMSSALDGVFQGQAALIVRARRTEGVSLS